MTFIVPVPLVKDKVFGQVRFRPQSFFFFFSFGAKLHCRMLGSAVMAQVAVVNNQREGVV